MNSLWKDLLFLHGHLAHKEDLHWRPDTHVKQAQDKGTANPKRTILACCVSVWPRIVGLR